MPWPRCSAKTPTVVMCQMPPHESLSLSLSLSLSRPTDTRAVIEQPPASLLKERAVFVESLGLDLVGEVLATFSDNNDTRQSCLSIFSSIAEQDTIGAEIARVGAVRMALEATKSLHAETVVRAVECLFHTTFPQMSDAGTPRHAT